MEALIKSGAQHGGIYSEVPYIMAEALLVVWPWLGNCPHIAEGTVGVAGDTRFLITIIGYAALVSKA